MSPKREREPGPEGRGSGPEMECPNGEGEAAPGDVHMLEGRERLHSGHLEDAQGPRPGAKLVTTRLTGACTGKGPASELARAKHRSTSFSPGIRCPGQRHERLRTRLRLSRRTRLHVCRRTSMCRASPRLLPSSSAWAVGARPSRSGTRPTSPDTPQHRQPKEG